MKKYYMHTLNSMPAFFSGDQICYSSCSRGARHHNILVETLGQIKKEQQRSNQYRKDLFLSNEDVNLSYIIVYTV